MVLILVRAELLCFDAAVQLKLIKLLLGLKCFIIFFNRAFSEEPELIQIKTDLHGWSSSVMIFKFSGLSSSFVH